MNTHTRAHARNEQSWQVFSLEGVHPRRQWSEKQIDANEVTEATVARRGGAKIQGVFATDL